MNLYKILKNRFAINLLKILYDNEFSLKKSRTMFLCQITKELNYQNIQHAQETTQSLKSAKLIAADENEDKEIVISLSNKGKNFIDQLDKLKKIIEEREKPKKAFKVEYDLTKLKKKILKKCASIDQKMSPIPLKILTKRLYPKYDHSEKSSTVSKYLKRLESLNLVKKIKKGNRVFYNLNESGKRASEN